MSKKFDDKTTPKSTFWADNKERILAMSTTPEIGNLLDDLKKYVETNCKGISTHQVRNIFSKVKTVKTPIEVQLLRPLVAYAAARQEKRENKEILMEFDNVMKDVKTEEQVENFVKFFEAFVAYHKFYNPK